MEEGKFNDNSDRGRRQVKEAERAAKAVQAAQAVLAAQGAQAKQAGQARKERKLEDAISRVRSQAAHDDVSVASGRSRMTEMRSLRLLRTPELDQKSTGKASSMQRSVIGPE